MIEKKNLKFFVKKEKIEPDISIIIPVYNTEKYLRLCLDSCINLTYRNIEIICIDDCSTDNSYQILQDYAKKDRRIKIYHNNENKLAGYCRNFGIEQSKGKYILFVDADDWIDNTLIEKCVLLLEKTNADICLFKNKLFNNLIAECKCVDHGINTSIFNGSDIIKSKDISNIFDITKPNPWSKCFNSKFLKTNKIQFLEKLYNSNDLFFTYYSLYKSNYITYINDYLYVYRMNNKNSSLNLKSNYSDNCIKACVKLLNAVNKNYIAYSNLILRIKQTLNWNFALFTDLAKLNFYYLLITNYILFFNILKNNLVQYKLLFDNFKLNSLVSIIIPVYNTEKYLRLCLDSCINLTYRNIEIICIDDCSTDNSYQILQDYAKKDRRIKIYHNNENKLAGYCRNFGIEQSKGKYILFVDADDWIDNTLIEKCVLGIEKNNANCCITNILRLNEKTGKIIPNSNNIENFNLKPLLTNCFLLDTKNLANVTTFGPVKMFKKDFIKLYDLSFYENVHNSEDVYFTFPALVLSTKTIYINENLYFYRTLIGDSSTDSRRIFYLESIDVYYTTYLLLQHKYNITDIDLDFYMNNYIIRSLKWTFSFIEAEIDKICFIKYCLEKFDKRYHKQIYNKLIS